MNLNVLRLFLTDFDKGGELMWVIFAVSIIAWFIGVEKMLYFKRFAKYRGRFLSSVHKISSGSNHDVLTGSEPFDHLLIQLRTSYRSNGPKGYKGYIREFLLSTVPALESGFSSMTVWISIAPLLGLLGTVVGMIQTFKVIMDFGVGNPSLTAEGISVALLTTQAGLTAAFPAMVFHNYLFNIKNRMVNDLFKDCEAVVSILNNPGIKTV